MSKEAFIEGIGLTAFLAVAGLGFIYTAWMSGNCEDPYCLKKAVRTIDTERAKLVTALREKIGLGLGISIANANGVLVATPTHPLVDSVRSK